MYSISIIVLTYNNETTIHKCLKAIANQDFNKKSYEVIIVDNGSNDNTLNIVKEFEFPIFIFPDLRIGQLRNKGVEISKAPVVGFVDSDCEIERDWITSVLAHFSDAKVGIAGFKYQLPDNPTWLEKNWFGIPNNKLSYDTLIPAGNMAVSKKLFNKLGGFDDSLITGEDSYLLEKARRNGYKTISDPDIKSKHHGNPKTVEQFYKREVWYGIGGNNIAQKIWTFDKPFILSNIVVFLFILLSIAIFTVNLKIIVFTIVMFFSLVFSSAINRRFTKSIKASFFIMVFLYIFYFWARVHSLLYIYKIKEYKKKQ